MRLFKIIKFLIIQFFMILNAAKLSLFKIIANKWCENLWKFFLFRINQNRKVR